MTLSVAEKIWADAIAKIGTKLLWEDPREAIPKLGREVIARIESAMIARPEMPTMALADEFAQLLGHKDATEMQKTLGDRFEQGDNRAGMTLRISDFVLLALRLVDRRLSTRV